MQWMDVCMSGCSAWIEQEGAPLSTSKSKPWASTFMNNTSLSPNPCCATCVHVHDTVHYRHSNPVCTHTTLMHPLITRAAPPVCMGGLAERRVADTKASVAQRARVLAHGARVALSRGRALAPAPGGCLRRPRRRTARPPATSTRADASGVWAGGTSWRADYVRLPHTLSARTGPARARPPRRSPPTRPPPG